MTSEEKVVQLLKRLDDLVNRQDQLSDQIRELKKEVSSIGAPERPPTNADTESDLHEVKEQTPLVETTARAIKPKSPKRKKSYHIKTDLEKFIGENLINKIGIAVTIIGVGIGAKYAIDNQLISPTMRIIAGYLIGISLLGFAIILKKKYQNFSAVLLSGSLAIMYFITYFAYSFYDLMPQQVAFSMMVFITAGAVYAALHYNQQVIAHIGLVGAYAVPFLVSSDTGNVLVLFSYMSIINIAVLVVSYKRYWKPLFYSSLGFTWLIFYSWFENSYQTDSHFVIALLFAIVFYVLFYLTFLAYKLIKSEEYEKEDIVLLIVNSFIFYGIGYLILSGTETTSSFLGLFTALNALVHFCISWLIYTRKLSDQNLFRMIIGIGLVFATLSIPIQLDGNWVTLIWIGEGAVLFWIGRTKTPFYERIAYILILVSFFSLLYDWNLSYNHYDPEISGSFVIPLLNIHFLSSMLFIAAFAFINWLNISEKYAKPESIGILEMISVLIPFMFVVVLYGSFSMEIGNYWSQLYQDSAEFINGDLTFDEDLKRFKSIWIINYSLLFFAILNLVNVYWLQDAKTGSFGFATGILVVFVFVTSGLYDLSELRESYLDQDLARYYVRDSFHILTRYFSIVFVLLLMYSCYEIIVQEIIKAKVKKFFDIFFHVIIVWILSSELIHWLDLLGFTESNKLGLSLLWGLYSIFLVGRGIQKKRKHLRVGAISLFGITLIKLFFYDISSMDTLPKTIVFIGLGILMLVASFLYNKYKDVID